jgi:putative peptide zinc metalloprotease protein
VSALTRRWPALLVVLLTCALPAGSAQAASTENVATAIIEEDHGRAFDFAWDVSRQKNVDVVDHLNSATARGRCLQCKATAIAFQIVLVSGSPGTVVPQNTAEAVNVECTECTVVAEARQFVRVVPDPVRFTGEGKAVLSDVRRDLAALEAQDPPIDQLHLAIEAQEARVLDVLDDELVLKSDPDTEPELLKQRSLQAVDLD